MNRRGLITLRLLLAMAACGGWCISEGCSTHAPKHEKATDAGPQTPPNFKVELVYSPALASQGSWVSLTIDGRGRLIASDQYGLLYRISPAPVGKPPEESHCEPIRVQVGAAQGMAFVNDSLYVMVNAPGKALTSGLYRVTDSNGDDQLDSVERLIELNGSGEHGPHAVVASPDGSELYFCAGNYTRSPTFTKSRVPAGWGEDQLLPRINDPAAQATGVPAPGGWIVKCDLQGQQCELFSVGYRNIYDLAFNEDGELFTCDSDLDVDLGTPWYRPPSLLHVTSGADYGWRGGDGLWPTYYPDTLPPIATLAPGSPTGLTAGTGAKFPARYRNAMFVGDWSRGIVYAVHLESAGSSYQGHWEPLATSVGAVTDLVVRPQDGALYFIVGGRQTQSGLYRIVWTGGAEQEVAPVSPKSDTKDDAQLRVERRKFEELHGAPTDDAVSRIWPGLSSPDRFVRFAALTALERTDSAAWQERAYNESNHIARFTALIGLARRDQPTKPGEWVDSVLAVDFPERSPEEQQAAVRAIALGVMRFRNLAPALRSRLATEISTWYPTGRREVDRELAKLLIKLESPRIVPPMIDQLANAVSTEGAIDAAVSLSAAKSGWSEAYRAALLDWFDLAATKYAKRSFYPYLVAARERFVSGFGINDQRVFAARLAAPSTSEASFAATGVRKFVKHWTSEEVVKVVETSVRDRQSEGDDQRTLGRQVYGALGCADCHSIAGEGASVGPDLTHVGSRYQVADLARAITQPSDEIPDLYKQSVFVVNGRSVTGRVTNMTSTTISVATDIRDPAEAIKLRRAEVESQSPSPLSAMPSNLLDTLTADEVVALFAYLRHDRKGAALSRP